MEKYFCYHKFEFLQIGLAANYNDAAHTELTLSNPGKAKFLDYKSDKRKKH